MMPDTPAMPLREETDYSRHKSHASTEEASCMRWPTEQPATRSYKIQAAQIAMDCYSLAILYFLHFHYYYIAFIYIAAMLDVYIALHLLI